MGSARADLIETSAYSRRTWGEARKDAYMAALYDRMQRLIDRPLASAAREEFAAGVRAARSGRHIIFFTHDVRQISVLRVLHERSNAHRRVVLALKQVTKMG